jgi:dihydrofolate reductase
MILIVAAYAENRAIGNNGSLPWPGMAADKKRFHQLIHGKNIVMGAKTYREYQKAKNAFSVANVFVLSHHLTSLPDATVWPDVSHALAYAEQHELWVIGGESVYEQLIPHASVMYLTEIDGSFKADTFFPSYAEREWKITSKESYQADNDNPYQYTFITKSTSN